MKKIPDPGKFSVSPLYKRASVKLMHMERTPVWNILAAAMETVRPTKADNINY